MSEADGRDAALETLSEPVRRRFSLFIDLLHRWQGTINLIAPATLPDVWTRHVADSLQVVAVAPDARTWVDLGSGGGFPGLVTAIALADQPGARVHLVESDKRKAAFLQTVVREIALPATIHAVRIERFLDDPPSAVDAVSARALAALPALCDYARPFLLGGAVGVFPKGETVDAELTALGRDRRFAIEIRPSRLRSGSSLVLVRAA